VSYASRIRPPDGALNPQGGNDGSRWLGLFLGLAVLVLIGWRVGWFRNGLPLPPAPPANPFRWK
jgi:hypothetical protein